MDKFNKPRLVEKNLIIFITKKNIKKQSNFSRSIISFLKSNFLIILFFLLFGYFLYYRYNLVKKNQQNIVQEEHVIQQTPRYAVAPIINKQVQEQTRFIPSDQQYAVPKQPQQQPYLKNIEQKPPSEKHYNNIDIDVNNYVRENVVDPINMNQNYLYENNSKENHQIDEFDYSLNSRRASFLTPQYIGHNFAPL